MDKPLQRGGLETATRRSRSRRWARQEMRGRAWYQPQVDVRVRAAYKRGRLTLAHARRCERLGSVSEPSPIDSTYQRGRRADGAVKVPMGERRSYCLGIWLADPGAQPRGADPSRTGAIGGGGRRDEQQRTDYAFQMSVESRRAVCGGRVASVRCVCYAEG
ncbi:hypothetical protein BJ912DRAFT_417076 [Pholiota molesta]|nr:hypothetical protein BJ912DRAFT_417076 [Pholiota molesta]